VRHVGNSAKLSCPLAHARDRSIIHNRDNSHELIRLPPFCLRN
jgi:hypothetical protein